MLYSVMYKKSYQNRYVVDIKIGKEYEGIIDTACSNTLVPLKIAKKHGEKHNYSSIVTVGGHSYKAHLYSFENVKFGNFNIEKLVAFAADYKGYIEDRLLIGNNILYNLKLLLFRNLDGKLKFDYEKWSELKTKEYPFIAFFGKAREGLLYPKELLVEIEDYTE